MPPHPSKTFEILKYYLNEPKVNGSYSRNNYLKQRIGVYVINLDEYEAMGTHWTAVYVNGNDIIYFHNSGVERIPKEIKEFIGNKNIITNIYRIQAHDLKTYVLGLLILCSKVKVCKIIQIYFLLMITRRRIK